MLGYDYLKFNNTKLPWAKSDKAKPAHIETIGTSEAGTDLGIVTRLNKFTYTYNFRVSSTWYDILFNICQLAQGTLYINGDAGRVVRPRMQSKDLVKDSQLTAGTDGLYDVTINFYEV